MKKILIILGIIIIVVGGGILFYLFTHQGANNSSASGTTGSLPSTGNQSLSLGQNGNASGTTGNSSASSTASSSAPTFGIVASDPTLNYYVDAQNNTIIIEPNGVIETITNGTPTIISSSNITNIISANFSYDGEKILVSSGDPANPQASVFDVSSTSWTTLPQGMISPSWSPYNYEIAFLKATSASGESIETINTGIANSKASTLTTISAEDLLLKWLNKNTLVLADRPSAYVAGSAWFFSIPSETLTSAVYEYPGMESLWSTNTSTAGIIFSGNSGYQGGTLLFAAPDGSQKLLSFTTLPSKCAFNEDVSPLPQISSSTPSSTMQATSTLDLYCAVPRDQSTFSVARLPDEYDQKVLFTADDFYKINTANGTLSTVFSNQNETLDATDLKVFNNTLLFINRYDQKLYGIMLQ